MVAGRRCQEVLEHPRPPRKRAFDFPIHLRVKLQDILEGMDFQSDERSSFLNLTTGEVVSITDEE